MMCSRDAARLPQIAELLASSRQKLRRASYATFSTVSPTCTATRRRREVHAVAVAFREQRLQLAVGVGRQTSQRLADARVQHALA